MIHSETSQIKRAIRHDLADHVFKPTPLRALWYLPSIICVVTCIYLSTQLVVSWYFGLLMALLIAICFAMNVFLGHELMHGALVKNKIVKIVLGYVAFFPFLLTPKLWEFWHVYVHHHNANKNDNTDPDSYGTTELYKKFPQYKFIVNLSPGCGKWYSYFYLFYWFNFEVQSILWIHAKYNPHFKNYKPLVDRITSMLMLSAWIVLGLYLGWYNSLFIILIPLLLANFTIMSYIVTNHFLMPLNEFDEPLETTMSVRTLPIFDLLHMNFSHHTEHHLFPGMSGAYLPLVRQWLYQNKKDSFVCPPHWKAIYYVYKTPRVYADSNTLTQINSLQDNEVDLIALKKILMH